VLGSRRINVDGGKPVIRNTNDLDFFIEREASRQGIPCLEWVVQTLDLQNKTWSQAPVRLPSITGSDIDKTVCFDIIGGYFYAVCSDQGRYVPDTVDWTSSYRVLRFLLGDMTQKEEVEDEESIRNGERRSCWNYSPGVAALEPRRRWEDTG
jgi:hypothetical protein